MRIAISMAAMAGGILLIAGAVNAQQPAAPYPLDVIPDKMPFSTPYGAPISLDRADAAIKAAVAEATKKGWPMNVAVVDSGGEERRHLRPDPGRRDRLPRRHPADRGGQVDWRHRLLGRRWLAGRGGLLGWRGDPQQAAPLAHLAA